MSKTEIRTYGLDLEVVRQKGKARLRGLAAPFNQQSLDLGGFVEVIKPGAFTRSLKNNDVLALVDHDPSMLLGRSSSGTLELNENTEGLHMVLDPPDTTYSQDIQALAMRGDMGGMSIGFRIVEGGSDFVERDDGQLVHEITDLDLVEVSAIKSHPAFPQTNLGLRQWKCARSRLIRLRLDKLILGDVAQ